MEEKRIRFEAQVLPHLDAAYTFARWLTRSPAAADDIVQESALRAFRAFDSLRGTDVKPWFLAIVKNCHLSAVKQQQRHSALPLPDEDDAQGHDALTAATPDPETQALYRDSERTLDRLIACMPVEFREVLVLREIEEMGYREIAAITNVPIGTVMSRLARARAALRLRWLREAGGDSRAMP